MKKDIFGNLAKHILDEISEIINAKSLSIESVALETGIREDSIRKFLNGDLMPNLTEFLALCEVSGISIKLPSVETPQNPM